MLKSRPCVGGPARGAKRQAQFHADGGIERVAAEPLPETGGRLGRASQPEQYAPQVGAPFRLRSTVLDCADQGGSCRGEIASRGTGKTEQAPGARLGWIVFEGTLQNRSCAPHVAQSRRWSFASVSCFVLFRHF